MGGSLVNGNGEFDSRPAAADAKKLKTSESPDGESSILKPFVVSVIFITSGSVFFDIESSNKSSKENQDQEDVDDQTSNRSDDEEEEISKDESYDSGGSDNLPGNKDISQSSGTIVSHNISVESLGESNGGIFKFTSS